MFEKLTFAAKLYLMFGIVLALVAIQTLFNISRINALNDGVVEVADIWLPSVSLVSDMNTKTSDLRIAEMQHVLSGDTNQKSVYEKEMQSIIESLIKSRDTYAPLIVSDRERKLFDSFDTELNQYLSIHSQAIALSSAMKTQEALELLNGNMKQQFDSLSGALLQLVQLNAEESTKSRNNAAELYASTIQMAIGTFVFLLATVIVIVWFFVRYTTRQLGGEINDVVEIVNKTAEGDLTVPISCCQQIELSGFIANKLSALVLVQ